jgi:hypothetical protein
MTKDARDVRTKIEISKNKKQKLVITAVSYIRRFINKLAYGQIFVTRDCLNFGRRPTIDNILSRMVKNGEITRVARGVFIKANVDTKMPSIPEIAAAKARGFGRRIHNSGSTAFHKFVRRQLRKKKPNEHVFATDGATTSFMAGNQRIVLKKYAPRKITLKDTNPGMAIRGLWERGRNNITDHDVQKTMTSLAPRERTKVKNSCNIMPAWLVDVLVYGFPCDLIRRYRYIL